MKRLVLATIFLLAMVTSACSQLSTLPSSSTTIPTLVPTVVRPTNPPPTATIPPTATVPPTATAVPTITSVATSPNALDALTKIFRSWSNVKSFRAKTTIQPAPVKGTPSPVTEMTLEVVTPDRFHLSSKQIEAILIGQTVYMKIGTQWQKVPLPPGLDLSFADIKKYETDLGASSEVKLIGPDVLDGTPMLVYQYTATIKTPTPLTTTSKVWVAISDGLPRKSESTSQNGTKTIIVFTDYNTNITIDAPIK